MSENNRRRGEFDDALKGYYQDHDEVLPEELTDYRSLTAESVGSLILGVLSLLTFISGLFVIFPLLGIILGTLAIRKILHASKELGGLGFASAGVALSVICAVTGLTYQFYVSASQIPPGYVLITFADLAADPLTGQIPEEALKLAFRTNPQTGEMSGTPVFIEGYMFPTRQRTEITNFMLVPSIEQSKFGAATRNPSEMVEVTMREELATEYKTSPVRVGGMLVVNEHPEPGQTPYSLNADVFH
ncbi:MAG: DUF3299 domain-containing protein [Planctomycetaceae bacterium]|jgi:hypothetical protein|nr:DUF3299 domain-containing protein [Planctomycetaceae bacterium]